MTREEIKEYLKDNLQISVNVKEITGYYESDKSYYKIEVSISLEGEEIDSSEAYT